MAGNTEGEKFYRINWKMPGKALAVWSLSLVFVEVVERVIGLSWSKH